MQSCVFCNKDLSGYSSPDRHVRQCKLNPDSPWTKEKREIQAKRNAGRERGSYSRNFVPCPDCGLKFSKSNIGKHVGSKRCKAHKPTTLQKPTCKFCDVVPRKGMELHMAKCKKNPDNVSQKTWSAERRRKHSLAMQKAVRENPDSYSKNNVVGRVKLVEYKPGVKLKGSWEVKVAEWLDQQDIKWENEERSQEYWWEGKSRRYFPDFYLPEQGCYIEVKGFRTDKDVAKWDSFVGVLLIFEKEAIDILDEIDIDLAKEKFVWS